MARAQDQLDSPFRRAMLYVIDRLGEVGVMKLEKILYLADLEHYYKTGYEVTGAKWVRHRFGPMAKAIVPSTKMMVGHEITVSKEVVGTYESDVYRPGPSPRFSPDLPAELRADLDKAIELARPLTATAAKDLAYNTVPMLAHLKMEAAQGQELWDVPLVFTARAAAVAAAIVREPSASSDSRVAFKRSELERVRDLQASAIDADR